MAEQKVRVIPDTDYEELARLRVERRKLYDALVEIYAMTNVTTLDKFPKSGIWKINTLAWEAIRDDRGTYSC